MNRLPNVADSHQAIPVAAEELRALRADAARYRWLRDNWEHLVFESAEHGFKIEVRPGNNFTAYTFRGKHLDAAVDVARKKASPDFHDDKPSETACNMAVTTQEGDLDTFGRPMRQGS